MKRFFASFLATLVIGCATARPLSPYSLYSEAIAQYNENLKAGKISNLDWLDISDALLLQYFTGDFRVPEFIKQRRGIYQLVEVNQITNVEGSHRIAEAFLKIKEETESRFYAQQLNLRYAEVMQDIQTRGLAAQSIAGDVGIIGGLALGSALRR